MSWHLRIPLKGALDLDTWSISLIYCILLWCFITIIFWGKVRHMAIWFLQRDTCGSRAGPTSFIKSLEFFALDIVIMIVNVTSFTVTDLFYSYVIMNEADCMLRVWLNVSALYCFSHHRWPLTHLNFWLIGQHELWIKHGKLWQLLCWNVKYNTAHSLYFAAVKNACNPGRY